jgi:tryptophan 2,3-dioxygenase
VTEPGTGSIPVPSDYSSYLLIDDLLALQKPLTEGAEDELLFIVVHQAYELWFKLILHELEGARSSLAAGEPWSASRRIRRAVLVEGLLDQQLSLLETMSPESFYEFRDPLAPASGFQSVQFREIELLSGGVTPSPGAVAAHDDAARARLAARASEPTLWDATVACLAGHGYPTGGDEVVESVATIYRCHDGPVAAAFHDLFERLVDHDEAIASWRYRHMLMAAREIGRRPGTGGSLGVGYLGRTLEKRFFPVLWEVRSRL